MLEQVSKASAGTFTFRASGTVAAGDVSAALHAALGSDDIAMGLMVILDPGFDGHFVELARGLADASLAHKKLLRIAVIADADQIEEATHTGFDVSAVPIRLFPMPDEDAALQWTSAARRDGFT